MVAVPADCVDTKPVFAFTVATEVLLLLHEPPLTVDENCAEAPLHKFWFPLSVPADKLAVTLTLREAVTSGHPPEPGTV